MSTQYTESAPLLEIDGVTLGYQGGPVVNDVSLAVHAGEVVCLLGPNGAGKTTTLSAVSGLIAPRSGVIRFEGRELRKLTPDAITRSGLVHVPEDRALFPNLTVRENLVAASGEEDAIREVLEYFPALVALQDRPASVLSGGEQQMLTLARAIVLKPRLLIVDELSLGLAPIIVSRILPSLRRLVADTGCGLLLVEQHVHLALTIADRAYVMVHGSIATEGSAEEIGGRLDEIRGTYLGEQMSGS
ncbi:MAG: ABC transporter ATP-binding protein [Leucobacter sp.]